MCRLYAIRDYSPEQPARIFIAAIVYYSLSYFVNVSLADAKIWYVIKDVRTVQDNKIRTVRTLKIW